MTVYADVLAVTNLYVDFSCCGVCGGPCTCG